MLEDRPALTQELILPWTAFMDLHTSRSVGMDVNPIAVSDIHAWLDIHQITEEEAVEIYWLIRSLDHTYFTWKGKQSKEKTSPRK